MRCYIFDIDGTLADLSHRLHLVSAEAHWKRFRTVPFPDDPTKRPSFMPQWDAFFDAVLGDAPIPHMIELARDLHKAGAKIIYVSGRSDACRADTERWMIDHGLPEGEIFMRVHGNHAPDTKVKAEILVHLRADGYDPIMAFDDRNSVVKTWRDNGVPCAQVADGDF